MELAAVEENGVLVIEAQPDLPYMPSVPQIDPDRVLDACSSTGTRGAILYAENLPPAFYDVGAGLATAILQKFRNDGVRLAVVCPPGQVATGSGFEGMLAKDRVKDAFAMFETRDAARDWLERG